jgi:murein DD-endopeptidase MepM/ murein hydrolase activator NlpD
MVWEQVITDDGCVKDGTVLIASYSGAETGGKVAIHFRSDDGNEAYYNMKGDSQRRVFLRAPLNYRRISSYFSKSRFHPILRYYRPHLGIDYAAAAGTPVVSIGAGTVDFTGWKDGSGNCIIIRHNGIFTSFYGHLSRYAMGMHRGVHVRQAQLIGYVGSTGLSTGPHLDFRVKKYGNFVNFLNLKIPPAEGVKKADIEQFNQEKRRLLKYLGELDQTSKEKDIITLEDVSYDKN